MPRSCGEREILVSSFVCDPGIVSGYPELTDAIALFEDM